MAYSLQIIIKFIDKRYTSGNIDADNIIIADFIDMEAKEAREELMEYLGAELKKDPVKTTLVDMTALGLVEMTRQKRQKSLAEQIYGA